uniref:NADH-ubiquinone oxidoreductase chain 1 n=1 Tax=Sericostoma personatum TaxID=1271737 RepID=A0A7G7CE92_9NEOP|nr:NADH dehydrogenase subunit 1 [Sericostoma personatum]
MNLLEVILSFVNMLILLVGVLVSVAFFSLLERKVLGYIQVRVGPNKVGFSGIVQPFNDAIKLFNKEFILPFMSNYLLFMISPIFMLFLSLMLWMLVPYMEMMFHFSLGLIFLLSLMSLSVYFMLLSGWSSNSNYALLGSLRGVAQVISYEVTLALMILSVVFLIMGYNFIYFYLYQKYIWFIIILMPLSFCLLSVMLAETNRSPFDFAEGESELVSGFNVDYSSGGFALIFMAEYSSILFMGMIFSVFMMGCDVYSIFFYFKLMFISYVFIWVRGTFPRYRYDKLMYLSWKVYLPISLNYLFFFLGLFICFWKI